MDERLHEQIEGPVAVNRKIEWIRPEVDRFLAGGAEGTDGADIDGADLLS